MCIKKGSSKVRKMMKKLTALAFGIAVAVSLTGCGSLTGGKRIIRVSHAQSETHPEHLGLLAFKEYVEEKLGDKYEVQIFPNELLGSAQKAIELTQTGAIDFVVAGTANLETFADVYEIFSMPYLFDSEEVYKSVMQDTEYMENVEVYTAIQQGVIDGAENNELALTNNKHGEVAKYYSYNKHQMVPDMLVANLKFLNSLSPEDYQVFKEAAALSTEVEMTEWDKSVQEAKRIASEEMGVEFIDVDVEAFKEKVLPLHESMLQENEKIRDLYDHIQAANEKAKGGQ